jgi:hypothetical protein
MNKRRIYKIRPLEMTRMWHLNHSPGRSIINSLQPICLSCHNIHICTYTYCSYKVFHVKHFVTTIVVHTIRATESSGGGRQKNAHEWVPPGPSTTTIGSSLGQAAGYNQGDVVLLVASTAELLNCGY